MRDANPNDAAVQEKLALCLQLQAGGLHSDEACGGEPGKPTRDSAVYAMGVTLWECLTGAVPFSGGWCWRKSSHAQTSRAAQSATLTRNLNHHARP